jgi:hypothetical protein
MKSMSKAYAGIDGISEMQEMKENMDDLRNILDNLLHFLLDRSA